MEKDQMNSEGEKNKEEVAEESSFAAAAAGQPKDKLTPSTSSVKTATVEDDDDEGEEEEDKWVTLDEVLKEVDEYEETEKSAKAVLGGSDEVNCSFAADPPRQALYACKTCEMAVRDPTTGEKYLAGVCLACSNHCHDGHDLVELYTKRNFVCDCGTDKFAPTGDGGGSNAVAPFVCKLFDKRGLLNGGNAYNHNFAGLYCTCDRPYPDEEDDVEDCMLQCGICEDWFHGRHLQKSGRPLAKPAFFEVLCEQCVRKHRFLLYYQLEGAFAEVGSMEPEGKESKESDDKAEDTTTTTAASSSKAVVMKEEVKEKNVHQSESSDSGIQEAASSSSSNNKNQQAVEDAGCKLAKLKASYLAKHPGDDDTDTLVDSAVGSLFFTAEWRHLLCQCAACLDLYERQEVAFITRLEDMTSYYEANGLRSVEEREEQAFASIPHVAKVELMHSLNGFKQRLGNFLNNFSGRGEVITKRHVEEFFADEYRRQDARKRQRTNGGLPPSECGSAGRH